MREPWLRGVEGGRMKAPQEEHVYSLVVKDLMDPLRKQWDRIGHLIIPRLTIFASVREMILDICLKEDFKDAGKVAVMMWVLWNNRNNWIWNEEKKDANQLGPPHPGWLKCNVDAGFNAILGTTNGGWCARDSGGRFMVAGTLWNRRNFSIVEAKAIALKEAIQGAINLHLQHIIFESDSQMVVQATNDPSLGNSEFSLIINSIRNLLSSRNDFEVKFVKRQANCVAP
ncbi:uncharacterized protein LOC131604770 [Vicia villosa]|uniref:uncharacterized protein LOC131604770 n=1 Tax=Vicia villosa TaxID=3911 RepID=UPI00273B7070|nr:uncharacterized protein LOC131604770 [Vicia villosa]